MHIAVQMGHLSLVNYLLLNGANINQRDSNQRTPICTSILAFGTKSLSQYQQHGQQQQHQHQQQQQQQSLYHNRTEIVKLLVKYGSNLDLPDGQHQTPLILAVAATSSVPIACIALLVTSGCDIDHIDSFGNTALTYAISARADSVVDLLLKNNAATHILDRQGRSVLSIACSLGAEPIVAKLTQRGLDEMHR